MQCRDAQFYLRLRRHAGDELGTDVAIDLDRHLIACPACAADARSAASFDRAMTEAIRAVAVPAGLRDRLLSQASAHRGMLLRRRAYRVGALAASLLLTVGIGFGVFSASRPKLDTATLVMAADSQVQDPDESLRKWLAGQQFPDKLPLPFDTDLLITYGSERVQGRDVPVVVFGRALDRGFAKVYLFRKPGEFDTKILQDAQGSHVVAKVIIDEHLYRGVVYVIVHTGPDLQPFLRTMRPA